MADDATSARQRAANVARQHEVARLALDVAPGGDWADALEACGLLMPKKLARAEGMRALAAAGYDGDKLSEADQGRLKNTLEKVSKAADGVAAERGTARQLPAADADTPTSSCRTSARLRKCARAGGDGSARRGRRHDGRTRGDEQQAAPRARGGGARLRPHPAREGEGEEQVRRGGDAQRADQ
eukprot:scaffold39843_cov185-Isochrysis_galbana.AAC.1